MSNLYKEAETYVDNKFKEEGRIPEKFPCACLRGVVTNAQTGLIQGCPACEGKGYRDEREFRIKLYLSGIK